jgi:predicted Zn-dependent peptidase
MTAGAAGDVRKTVLPNGVRIVTERMPGLASVAIGVWIESGSRHDGRERSGLSHFVEHLLFKGTARRSAAEIAQEIDAVGGVLNADTDREHTCYYARVLAEHAGLAIDLLSDMVLASRFDPVEVDREREVVLEEIAQIEDTPDEHVQDLFHAAYWPDHPLGRPICGTRDTVAVLDRAACLDLLARRYRPNRIVVAAAGRFEHEAVVEEITQRFGGLTGAAALEAEAPGPVRPGVTVHERRLGQVRLYLGTGGLAAADPRRTVAAVLNAALGDGASSRLFQEIRERRGRAYAVDSGLASYRDSGYLAVTAGTRSPWVAEVVECIVRELGRVRREGFSAAELERTKGRLKGALLLALESSDQRMEHLGLAEMYLGRCVPAEELAARIDAVTNDEIVALAGHVFVPDACALVLLGKPRGASLDASVFGALG